MDEELINRFGGLSLPRKSVDRLTGRPDVTVDVNNNTIPVTTFFYRRNRSVCVYVCEREREREREREFLLII